jgi:transposase
VPTTSEGHLALVAWAAQWPQVRFALEDCRHLTRRLEQDLLAAGHRVVRVPTRLMAGARRGARQPGKSDPIDAEAVALAALRHEDLPVAELDGPTREVKLLVDYRRDLVRQRTRVQNRLRWHLHELDRRCTCPPADWAATASSTSCSTGSPRSAASSPDWPASCSAAAGS